MYYVKEHAIDRLIDRVDDVPRDEAKNMILGAMLFYDKTVKHPKWLMNAYKKDELIVISSVNGDDENAVTSVSIKNANMKSWWAKQLLA